MSKRVSLQSKFTAWFATADPIDVHHVLESGREILRLRAKSVEPEANPKRKYTRKASKPGVDVQNVVGG
jgi:hypothetical protein